MKLNNSDDNDDGDNDGIDDNACMSDEYQL